MSSNEELIDDLNDGDRYIMSINGRMSAWNDAHDDSSNAKMYPDSSNFVPSQTGDTYPDGVLCTQNPSTGPTACFDHYGSAVSLTTEWQKYRVASPV